jgi:hypothetical protein
MIYVVGFLLFLGGGAVGAAALAAWYVMSMGKPENAARLLVQTFKNAGHLRQWLSRDERHIVCPRCGARARIVDDADGDLPTKPNATAVLA